MRERENVRSPARASVLTGGQAVTSAPAGIAPASGPAPASGLTLRPSLLASLRSARGAVLAR